MSDASVSVESVSRRYGRRWALADVSFTLEPGSVMMLAGRNGSGKSTLLRVLSTAIRPDRGTATIGGFDLTHDREDVRKVTALLSHATYLYETLTARENLEVFADHMGIARTSIPEILDRVTLGTRANDAVSTFSAGMRKRLAFARVLLQDPRVAMLDEPYGALDPPGFALVEAVVRELKSRGTTVLLATHQWQRVADIADKALVLEEGRVEWFGEAGEAMLHEVTE